MRGVVVGARQPPRRSWSAACDAAHRVIHVTRLARKQSKTCRSPTRRPGRLQGMEAGYGSRDWSDDAPISSQGYDLREMGGCFEIHLDQVNQVRLQIAQIGAEVLREPANQLCPRRDHKGENTVSGIVPSQRNVRGTRQFEPATEASPISCESASAIISAKPRTRRFLESNVDQLRQLLQLQQELNQLATSSQAAQ
jgi:hypothetical protein